MNKTLLTYIEAKVQAKRLRAQLAAQGTVIGHAAALEQIAHRNGYHDWNSLYAAISDRAPQGWIIGGRVTGAYLSHPFAATILAIKIIRPGWFRLSLDLDQPVDVVTFDSFSNFRKRVNGVVGPKGMTREKTSDGVPHLKIDM